MRIAVLHNSGKTLLSLRGDLIKAIVGRNHRVTVLVPDMDSRMDESMKDLGVEVVLVPFSALSINPIRELAGYYVIREGLKACDPDLLFSSTIKPVIYGSIAAHSLRKEVRLASMITGLGRTFLHGGIKGVILNRCVRILYRIALSRNEVVFFHNTDDLKLFREQKILMDSTPGISHPGGGVNLNAFPKTKPPTDPVSFLFLGRLIRQKGIHEFYAAAKSLKGRHPNARFVVCGPLDEGRGEITKRDIGEWVNSGTIDYNGFAMNPAEEYQATSVFVLPSYREGMSRAVQEAMATGRPIISTDAPGCREAVIENQNGFIVPCKDSKSLEQAMEKFIKDPSLITAFGEASYQTAKVLFDEKIINARILDALKL